MSGKGSLTDIKKALFADFHGDAVRQLISLLDFCLTTKIIKQTVYLNIFANLKLLLIIFKGHRRTVRRGPLKWY